MTGSEIKASAQKLVSLCIEKAVKISTAESCTGGMISAAVTAISGSSAVIEMGICSYSNRIKSEILGVSDAVLSEKSEYSIECAEEMAKGARKAADADFAVSTTGVAGPTGGSDEHPVGEVFIGISTPDGCRAERFVFSGDRDEVRKQAAFTALELLYASINNYYSER